jgi:hypothetical protein
MTEPLPSVDEAWDREPVDVTRDPRVLLAAALYFHKLPPSLRKAIQEVLASPPPAIPEGFVLVPKEPTSSMMKAGEVGWCAGPGGSVPTRAGACYRAMLAAAPQPIAQPEQWWSYCEEPRTASTQPEQGE